MVSEEKEIQLSSDLVLVQMRPSNKFWNHWKPRMATIITSDISFYYLYFIYVYICFQTFTWIFNFFAFFCTYVVHFYVVIFQSWLLWFFCCLCNIFLLYSYKRTMLYFLLVILKVLIHVKIIFWTYVLLWCVVLN